MRLEVLQSKITGILAEVNGLRTDVNGLRTEEGERFDRMDGRFRAS